MELGRDEKPARAQANAAAARSACLRAPPRATGSAATGRAARLKLGPEDPRLGIEMKGTQINHVSRFQARNLEGTLYREEAGL
jgi:hypothetical protein